MKIAIIADALDYQYAGIYYYTKELVRALAKIDKENDYLIVRSQSEGDFSKNVKELIIPTPKFPGGAAYRLFITVPRLLTKEKVDIVVEPRHFGPFNLPSHIKRITVIHDLSPLRFPQWHELVSRKLQKFFLPSILRRAHHIITNSQFTAQDVRNYFPFTKGKTTGILLGKEVFFKPDENKSILEKYDLNSPYLLHTGTIEPRKNLSFLLNVFEKVKGTTPSDLQLVLAGKVGWGQSNFLERVERSPYRNDIKLLGYVPREHLPAIYTGATLFIYPSHFEGFGLPALEAMSCGLPTLVSDNSSLPEIVGTAGLTFPTNDVSFLQNTILSLLNNAPLRQKMAEQSLRRAEEFSWEKTAKETLTIFENLMK